MSATLTPARIANVTPARIAASVTPALAPVDTLSAPDALRAAIAAVDSASDSDTRSRGALKAATLARFSFHADRLSVELQGGAFLPSNLKSEAQSRVWRDATGESKPVPAKDRTAGQTSLGQYLSKFAKVATDLTYGGIAELVTVERVEDSFGAIGDAAKLQGERDKVRESDKVGRAFIAWRDALPSNDRAALTRVIELFAVSDAAEFAPLYAAALLTANASVDHAERA